MITLITGGPGTGKTALLVSLLLTDQYKNRILYSDGIKELKIDHETFNPETWPTELPDGVLAIIDECQRIWRPAGSAKLVPDHIQALETHRHKGIDFIIITQHPSLIHNNVRRLVGKHIHIVSNWAGRKTYEWPECKTDPSTGRSTAISNNYKLPKKVFDLYISAEIHTKQKRKYPFALYIFVFSIICIIYLVYAIFISIDEKFVSPEEQNTSFYPSDINNKLSKSISKMYRLVDFEPVVPFIPESAPIYDSLRKVKSFPQNIGCISSSSKDCICYTQQGTIYKTSDYLCNQFINSKIFNPYKEDKNIKQKRKKQQKRRNTNEKNI